jgi:hypothetical protein
MDQCGPFMMVFGGATYDDAYASMNPISSMLLINYVDFGLVLLISLSFPTTPQILIL